MDKQIPQAVSKALLLNPPQNIPVPKYDRETVTSGIVHLGVGGFHRAHEALYIQELIEDHGQNSWGICGVGIMPQDSRMAEAMNSQNLLYTLVERSESEAVPRLVGSIVEYIFGVENPEQVIAKIADPQIKIVTLTATEGGYCFNQGTGKFNKDHPGVQNDLNNPGQPQTIFGYLAEGLQLRKDRGVAPLTILSCDNLQGNGDICREMLLSFCELKDPELAKWIADNIQFPNSMVDRITPATTDREREMVKSEFGLADKCPVVCEDFRQWVIEDRFSSERPPFEKVGVQMTDDVRPYEKMKIRLLNASHSCMGYLGYLCDFRFIHDVAQDAEFDNYIRQIMDKEVTDLVGEIEGVDLEDYKTTLRARFANPAIGDQVLRICLDGSAKLPKFVVPSIQEQLERGGAIAGLTLCIASWIRFVGGVDEHGEKIPLDDPEAERLRDAVARCETEAAPFLELSDIFGDLKDSARFVAVLEEQYSSLRNKGARETLKAFLNGEFDQ